MDEITNGVELLKGKTLTAITVAAKMAGLRWKNGALDKAGIIQALAERPAVLRATLATLARMESTSAAAPKVAQSFMDDIEEEKGSEPLPLPAPSSEPSGPAKASPEISQAINSLTSRVQRIEDQYLNRAQIMGVARDVLAPFKTAVESEFSSVKTEIENLKKQAPIVFNIGGIETPQVSGTHKMFPRMVKWLSVRKVDPITRDGPRTHVLLVGPASSGKTSAAISFAKLKGLELYSQPLSMDSFAVVGYLSPDGKRIETEFTRAWINGGVYLWDELSMSAPEALGTLNSALANGFATIPGLGVVKAHPDFYCIAGDNSDSGASLKYGARSLMDGASLDRFIRLEWPIDTDIERSIAGSEASNLQWLNVVQAIRLEIDRREIAHVGATMRALITGCMALSTGAFTRREILEDTCKKGILCDQWEYFEKLPAVQAFLRG